MARMTEQEMQELAEKLVEMPIARARRHTRLLDRDVEVQMYRVGFKGEILTKYRLPSQGVAVTLVEVPHEEEMGDGSNRLKFEPEFVEARVEPLA